MATITLGTKTSLNDATTSEWDDAAFDRQDPVLTIDDLEKGCDTCNPNDGVDDLGLDQDLDDDFNSQQYNLSADQILMSGIKEMFDRSKTYDSPGGERSMGKTVAMYNSMVGSSEMTIAQGWKFMTILKLVRSEQGDFRLDSFIDGAAYMSLAGESSAIENAMKDGNNK